MPAPREGGKGTCCAVAAVVRSACLARIQANTLLADHIFSPALLLAERIERGLIPLSGRTTIELGAGTALPSLLASVLPHPPALVVVTDYPDPVILGNLQRNVARNAHVAAPGCTVLCRGHDWGQDHPASLPTDKELSADSGFDVVILSDLLHFDRSHPALLASLTALLARAASARVYVAAGSYTRPAVCDAFLRLAEEAGIMWEQSGGGGGGGAEGGAEAWMGTMRVTGLQLDQLAARKAMCRWWVGRWSEAALLRPETDLAS
ncbi:hypothetical protein HETIRDRAFT_479321 [Heterobasidion irregulare TC 32-1]|uniref:Uncharacterized protein n=1 Tax=Heterobasidion irregulare (strain TC 32-1) TaxID=747525 RepID=W4JXE1_HETIT|nr:uncharacterized protein HETIRDRAFT_479321 [Heterobasidion irregulare TC 32-1]ETW78129.1 hypothetical protein HETIRDRAFT_479321 [Heterobasidion irregulare TC 32-1]